MSELMQLEACHACGYEMDAVTGVGHDDSPEAGNVSGCLMCGAISIFEDKEGGGLQRRLPTSGESESLAQDEDIMVLTSTLQRRAAARLLPTTTEPKEIR